MNQAEVQRVFVTSTLELIRLEMPDVPIDVVIRLLTAVVRALEQIAEGDGEETLQ